LCVSMLLLLLGGKFDEPCDGLDCSRGCRCFPEKGSRVSLSQVFNCVLSSGVWGNAFHFMSSSLV
uniref:Uncharacterized protein n=2 Tax=Haplochromini TaxID=319058 RepID=A0A3Q2W7Y6_HAPBU